VGRRIAVAGAEQFPEPLRVGDDREVLGLRPSQRIFQVARRIRRGPTGGDRVAKDLAAIVEGAVGRLDDAAALDPTQHLEKLRRRDGRDRCAAEPREDVVLEPGDDLLGVTRRPASLPDLEPLTGGSLERTD